MRLRVSIPQVDPTAIDAPEVCQRKRKPYRLQLRKAFRFTANEELCLRFSPVVEPWRHNATVCHKLALNQACRKSLLMVPQARAAKVGARYADSLTAERTLAGPPFLPDNFLQEALDDANLVFLSEPSTCTSKPSRVCPTTAAG